METKKLWLKISGSITYYFKYYNSKLSDEELWLDYVEYALPNIEGDGVHTYLNKQTLERVIVNDEMMDKAKTAFMERLKKRRLNETNIEEGSKVLADVIDILKYRK